MRLAHITGSPPNPSHFAVLVRSIPKSSEQSYSDLVQKFFTNYHGSSYLSHQMIYECCTVPKIMVCIILEYFRILLSSYYICFLAWLDLLCCYSGTTYQHLCILCIGFFKNWVKIKLI